VRVLEHVARLGGRRGLDVTPWLGWWAAALAAGAAAGLAGWAIGRWMRRMRPVVESRVEGEARPARAEKEADPA